MVDRGTAGSAYLCPYVTIPQIGAPFAMQVIFSPRDGDFVPQPAAKGRSRMFLPLFGDLQVAQFTRYIGPKLWFIA
jgi:hypothetical protein